MSDKPKRPRDANQLAKFIVDVATGKVDGRLNIDTSAQKAGGEKGGRARADKLSKERKSEIARKAAKARWDAKT